MNAKRVMTWVVIAFVVFFVLSSPSGAANTVKQGVHLVGSAATQLASFVRSLGVGK